MGFFKIIYGELTSFFGIDAWLEMMKSGDYSRLFTLDGVLSAIGPLIPLLLIFEIIRAIFYKRFRIEEYRVPFFIIVFNRSVGRFLTIGVVLFIVGLLEKYALLKTRFTWYWLIYGYIIWEFSHFVYHYLAHKVRILWCLHSTHHAAQHMNLSITYAHFFLEAPYADIIRTSICILLGVNPPLLFFIMFIDGTWGAFIHIGENFMKDARLGFLNHWILTPSHHRVHHARNPLYMDTNFCNLLNIWDRVFGTFQYEKMDMQIDYGITRKINPNNFWDVYFGEIFLLWRDLKSAPGFKNKFMYLFMPPGWSHTGDHKTARVLRKLSRKDPK
ncbi:MAG: fatty acid hydroxylase [Bacteroidetes bacterium]|nr:MAG: fatty acid hydroxylase [Bacteroidota bacterium]